MAVNEQLCCVLRAIESRYHKRKIDKLANFQEAVWTNETAYNLIVLAFRVFKINPSHCVRFFQSTPRLVFFYALLPTSSPPPPPKKKKKNIKKKKKNNN